MVGERKALIFLVVADGRISAPVGMAKDPMHTGVFPPTQWWTSSIKGLKPPPTGCPRDSGLKRPCCRTREAASDSRRAQIDMQPKPMIRPSSFWEPPLPFLGVCRGATHQKHVKRCCPKAVTSTAFWRAHPSGCAFGLRIYPQHQATNSGRPMEGSTTPFETLLRPRGLIMAHMARFKDRCN